MNDSQSPYHEAAASKARKKADLAAKEAAQQARLKEALRSNLRRRKASNQSGEEPDT